jgi:hypothetical protein
VSTIVSSSYSLNSQAKTVLDTNLAKKVLNKSGEDKYYMRHNIAKHNKIFLTAKEQKGIA